MAEAQSLVFCAFCACYIENKVLCYGKEVQSYAFGRDKLLALDA
jgi:hypothetical protein